MKTIEKLRDKAAFRVSQKSIWERTGFDVPIDALKKIMTYIKNGMYDDAMELCIAKYDSERVYPFDERLYNVLYLRAMYDQQSEGLKKISQNQAIENVKQFKNHSQDYITKYAPVYEVEDLGDCYYVQEWVTRNANGGDFYFVFDNGMVVYINSGSTPEFTFSRNCVSLCGYSADIPQYDIYAE